MPDLRRIAGIGRQDRGYGRRASGGPGGAGYRAMRDSHHYRVIQFLLDRMRYAERIQGGTHLWGARKEARKE